MIITIIISLIITSTLILRIIQKVITIGILLMFTALIIAGLIAMLLGSWYSFILFLIYITGLLVIFAYLIAIRPNSYQSAPRCIFATCIWIFITSIVINNSITLNINKPSISIEKIISNIFAHNNTRVYWFIAIILLLALLIVVSLCYKSPNPLRIFS